ncbi:hypothetical protein [Photobacterium sp. GSS17]|uniref:hypothetical protein n=1 Tax=Photobacterium sp. GSS17 TaxID=3020715 RepID=UPI003FCDB1EC
MLKHGLKIINDKAITYVLDSNHTARKLYESECFKLNAVFDSTNTNNGYPCTVLKLSQ